MLIKPNFKLLITMLTLFVVTQKTIAQDYFFERVYDETLAQASYFIADPSTREAIVIDPKRDIDTYLDIAYKNNFKITKVTETHIHADFLSGARELAKSTNATLLLSDEGGKDWQYNFPHKGLKDGNVIKVGKIELKVMHTPGHTPESITFLVKDKTKPFSVERALTGDFVFVGDVGRPDLLEKAAGVLGSQEVGAKQLYKSIEKFSKLDDLLEIWPGHGAGSFCGKSLSNIPQSTLKNEKLSNPAFQFIGNENGFIQFILDGQPAPPKYFAKMKELNKNDRPLLLTIPNYATIKEAQLLDTNDFIIIDTRNKQDVIDGYFPNSLHIENSKSFPTWVGALVDYDKQLVLIANADQKEDITRKLMRIGMDNVYGFVTNVTPTEVDLRKAATISIDEVKKALAQNTAQIIDVRSEAEYQNGHIKGVENIVLTSLENNLSKINKAKPVVVHCQSGARAAMAYSVLKQNGFEDVTIYSGGINEWTEKNNKLEVTKQNN